MSSKLIHLLVALASAAAAVVALEVPVTIYYESLCPDSKAFFRDQFNTVYNSSTFKKYLKTSFIPWGHANVTADVINCQHGAVECDGNRLMACALNKINQTDRDTTAKYIGCIMALNITKDIPSFPFEQCGTEAGAYFNDIKTCYNNTNDSTALLKAYQAPTEAAFKNRTFGVPYVAFNNTINDAISAEAVKNFQTALCNNLKSENLKECGNSASTLTATLIPAAILFLLGRL